MAISKLFFTRTQSFIYGLTLPWTAVRLILSRRALLLWSVIPIGITLAIYVYLIRWLEALSRSTLLHTIAGFGWNPEGWGAEVLFFLTRLLMIVVAAISFSLTSSVIASPFNDWLAESAEPWTTPALSPPHSETGWTLRNARMKAQLVAIDVLKSLASFSAMVLALLLSWIPVINSISFIIAFLLMTFQYISYPQTRRGEGLGAGLEFLWKHAFACAGLGFTLSLLFAVPVVSCLALPIAVVSGTLLYARSRGSQDLFQLK